MKVFCIGFNKCGTTTLHHFFVDNNLKSVHNTWWWLWKKKSKFNDMQCFTDGYEYLKNKRQFPDLKMLEEYFPDAKFIIQTRSLNKWLLSRMKKYFRSIDDYDHQLLLRWIIDRNHWYKILNRYFQNKNNYLVLDIDDPNREDKICNFLNIENTGVQFRSKNVKHQNNVLKKKYIDRLNKFLNKYIVESDHDTIGICKLKQNKI